MATRFGRRVASAGGALLATVLAGGLLGVVVAVGLGYALLVGQADATGAGMPRPMGAGDAGMFAAPGVTPSPSTYSLHSLSPQSAPSGRPTPLQFSVQPGLAPRPPAQLRQRRTGASESSHLRRRP
jgi:hypothetical protein